MGSGLIECLSLRLDCFLLLSCTLLGHANLVLEVIDLLVSLGKLLLLELLENILGLLLLSLGKQLELLLDLQLLLELLNLFLVGMGLGLEVNQAGLSLLALFFRAVKLQLEGSYLV